MKLKLPKDLTTVTDEELENLLDQAIEEFSELAAIDDADLTEAQIADIEQLGEAVDSINAEKATREEKAEERKNRAAAAKAKLDTALQHDADAEEAEAEDEEEDEESESEDEPEEEDETEVEAEVSEREPVAASAARRSAVRTATLGRRRTSTRPQARQEEDEQRGFRLNAAADVPSYASGSELADWNDMAKAFMNRAKGMRGRRDQGQAAYGVANLSKPKNEFALTERSSVSEQLAVLEAVANEKRLPKGGLIATGGWCAPSETLYDFQGLETATGLVSVPEFQVTHGGINFTQGPLYSDLVAANNFGFTQTEAQAEGGQTKPIFSVRCPDWDEVRMDAIGFGIRAGILTNAQFPELVARTLQMAAVAHAHRRNSYILGKIVAGLGTAIDYTEQGSGTADFLNGIELVAEYQRTLWHMAPGAAMEVVLPMWARLIARQDLALRVGAEGSLGVTDQQVNQWFAVRGLNVQWVYDLDDTAIAPTSNFGKAMPTQVTALIYPAGTFVVGAAPVISLDAVYDSTGLSTNDYIAAFYEEGILVAKRGLAGAKVTIALNYKGAAGFPSVGAGAGITFAAA